MDSGEAGVINIFCVASFFRDLACGCLYLVDNKDGATGRTTFFRFSFVYTSVGPGHCRYGPADFTIKRHCIYFATFSFGTGTVQY